MKGVTRGSWAVDVLAVLSLVGFGMALAFLLGVPSLLPEGRSGRTTAGLAPAEFATLFRSGAIGGNENAPVKLIVYSDFRCGYSRELYFSLAELGRRYPDHLVVSWRFLSDDSTPRERGFLVPEGAYCAGDQGQFVAYVEAAFRNANILDFSDAAERIGWLVGISDPSRFRDCIEHRIFAETVSAVSAEAASLGVLASPTIFVNGERISGAPPLAALDSIVVRQFLR